MKRFKIFTIALALSMFLPFFGIVAHNIYLDPDEIFHKGKNYPFIASPPNYYRNAGIINNYEMRNIIVGDSLIKNMIPSEVEQVMGWQDVFNLSFTDVFVATLAMEANYAMRKHKIDNVIFALQPLRLMQYPVNVKLGETIPKDFGLLYDDNPFNDVKVFEKIKYHKKETSKAKNSLSKTKKTFPDLKDKDLFTASKDIYPTYMRSRYQDFNRPLFNLESGLKFDLANRRIGNDVVTEVTPEGDNNLKNNFELYLRPMIEKHPDTTFYFIIENATFEQFKNSGIPLAHAIKFLVGELSSYSNVRMFSFAGSDFNADIRLFKDSYHDHIEVERYKLQSIRNGWDPLTPNNVDAHCEGLIKKLQNYKTPEIWHVEEDKEYPKEGYITYYDAAKLTWGKQFNEKLFNSIPRSPYLAEATYVEGGIKTSPPLDATRQEFEKGRQHAPSQTGHK